MKKSFCISFSFVLLSIFFSTQQTHAQKLFFLFAHGQYALPADSYFKHNYNYGLGVEGGAGIGTSRTFLVATVGYTSFKSVSGNSFGNTSYVPIKGGIRHYLLVGKILFIQVDGGVGMIKNNFVNSSRFSGDAGLGVKLGPFEVIADYDGFTRGSAENSGYSSWIGIKAGFRFGM
ncbi:MAG: hypothetical protein JST75_01385 [Bacteroidetes bacterium]|nr:hypothetical protein [Bacteroidota bacterium]